MPKNGQIEVFVIGAGPVGMMTALLSAQHGLRTRIIDQEARTATHSYACALHPGSLRLLERAGIVEQVIALGRRVETVGLYDGPARRAEFKFSDLSGRFPFALVLGQFLLEELLEEKLRAAGVHVEWHCRLQEINPVDGGVEATIEKLAPSGRGYIIPELETAVRDRLEVHAEFVVGADGHNSRLRRQLGIDSDASGAAELYAVHEMETAEAMDHEMKLVLGDAGLSVLWPMGENKGRWSFQIIPPETAADFPQKDRDRLIIIQPPSDWDSFHHLRRFLAERAPWFQAEIKDILWVAHAQFERKLARHFGRGRCWLAGDAAHQASPAGMQSMNNGLNEAADLADKLKSILRDRVGMDLLGAYDRVHHAEWKRLLGLKPPGDTHPGSSPWAQKYYPVILGNLPASGDDLNQFMEKL